MKKTGLLAALVLVLGLLFHFARDVSFDNSRWLPDNDPVEILKNYTINNFNNQKSLIIAISLEQTFFSKDVLEALISLEDNIKNALQIEKINHPLNLSFLIKDRAGVLNATTLKNQFLKNKSDTKKLQEQFTESYYHGRYISNSLRSFLIVIKSKADKEKINQAVVKLLNNHSIFSNFKLAGRLKIDYELNKQNIAEMKRLIPMVLIFVVVFLALYYRNLKTIFIVAVSAIATLLGSFAVFYLLKIPISILTSVVPLLIVAIAISDSIHIINRYFQENKRNAFNWKSFMIFTWKPCFITSLTTSIGFFSFYQSSLLTIKELAIVAPVAILFSYTLIIGSNWALLYILAPKAVVTPLKINWLKNVSLPPWQKTVVSTALIAFSALSVYHLAYTETNILDSFFSKKSAMQRDAAFVDNYHGGTGTFDLIIGRQKSGPDFKNINTYRQLLEFEESLQDIPAIKRMESYLMPVQMTHKKFASATTDKQPQNSETLAQELLFLEFSQSAESEDVLRPFLNFEGKVGRVVVRTANLSNRQALELKQSLQQKISTLLPWPIEFIGNNQYFLHLSELILGTQISSLATTLIAICILMLLFYGGKTSLMAVAANLLSVSWVLLSIVWAKIPFDFSTVLIASIGLGLSIDNGIHLAHHLVAPSSAPHQTHATFREALTPILVVTIIFVAIFGLFATSPIIMLKRFGIFSMVMMISAFCCNIFIFLPQKNSGNFKGQEL